MIEIKNIYRGKEFKFYNELMSLRQELTDDFLRMHPNFSESMGDSNTYGSNLAKQFTNYRATIIKYDTKQMKVAHPDLSGTDQWQDNTPENFPTAYKLFEQFPRCYLALYAVMMPHSVIKRHTGVENRDGSYIRVHLPLIVPDGDIGFEVAGEQVDWSDLFAFNNQRVHSAWNNTNHPRLVMLFDFPRDICDLPPGIPWTYELDQNTPRFPKGEKPLKETHENI
jgi:hypothetical protein